MKGLESPVKKRARLSLKKRESICESSPQTSNISSTLSPAFNSAIKSNVTSTPNSTNSFAAFNNNINTATPTASAAITTCATTSSAVTTTSTTSAAVATSAAPEAETPRKTDASSRNKDADNLFDTEANNDVISINSDDVYESMPIVAALENLDNTCFLNSVLQILRYTPRFIHGLNELCYKVSNAKKGRQVDASRSVNEDINVSCQVWEMTLAISEIFKQMSALEKKMQGLSNVSSTNIALKPEKVQQVVRKLNSMFEGSAQHDAQEFLQFILYHLQEAEKQMKKCNQEVHQENGTTTANRSPNASLVTSPGSNNSTTTATVTTTTITNIMSTSSFITTTTTTSSSNNTISLSNESVSVLSNFTKSSISKGNTAKHESSRVPLKTSEFNSLQKPNPDVSSTQSSPQNSTSQTNKESISHSVNSRSLTASENNKVTKDPYITHNGTHSTKANGVVSNLGTVTGRCYLDGTLVNGRTEKTSMPGAAVKTDHCTPLPPKVSSKHTSSCPIPLLSKSGAPPCLANDNSLSLGILTNGMSKNQVKQIKNAIVKLEKCDLVCSSPQKSVNAYYAIECLNTGRTLNGKKKDFVEQLFLGTILSRTRCLECEKASEKHEEFLEVSVPLKKAAYHSKNSDGEGSDLENEDASDRNTLISFISSFSEVEKLQGDNKYYCDSCCNYVEADRSLHYETLPDILTVHLKRFSASSELGLMCKINDHVDVPLSLPCLLYKCHKNCCRQDHRYTLFGIITHAGYTISSGHYVAYVKTSASALTWHFPSNGQREGETSNVDTYSPGSDMQQDDDVFWLECDDSSVRVFTEEDFLERLSSEGLLTGTPYLLFYHKSPMSRSF